MIDNALEGYSVTVFAYGQTGSGKSYSYDLFNSIWLMSVVERQNGFCRAIDCDNARCHHNRHVDPLLDCRLCALFVMEQGRENEGDRRAGCGASD